MQLAIPRDGEDAARNFYAVKLGIPEVPKPPLLAARGGCWFEIGEVRIHVGVEDEIPGALRGHVDDPFGNRLELIEAGSVEAGPDEGVP